MTPSQAEEEKQENPDGIRKAHKPNKQKKQEIRSRGDKYGRRKAQGSRCSGGRHI